MAPTRRVCVTGGSGFIASWLVKLLLSRGYAVHATLRDPSDPKNVHLKQLGEAPENLHLFKADVLDCETLTRAFEGCEGVFHLATPVPEDKIVDPESEVMAPAVKGTSNVLKVCSAMKVQKVIVLSSTAAVDFNPSWPQDRLKDESCWSDKEFCKKNEDWYSVAKIVAEQASFEYAEKNGLNVVTLCPPLVFGPVLQPMVNTSSKFLIYVMKGGPDVMNNKQWHIVDVRDVANTLLLVYEKAESSERYICAPNNICTKDLVDLLKKMYPKYSYVNNIVDVDRKAPITSQKLRDLGWEPRKLEETLMDSVECYEKAERPPGIISADPRVDRPTHVHGPPRHMQQAHGTAHAGGKQMKSTTTLQEKSNAIPVDRSFMSPACRRRKTPPQCCAPSGASAAIVGSIGVHRW